jgi:hypothetical protein
MAIGCILFFISFFLIGLGTEQFLPTIISAVGGVLVGISVAFSMAAKQLPLWVHYTTFKEEDLQKRLEELKNA